MKMPQVGLSKLQWYRRLKVGMIALSLAILLLGLSPVGVAQADSDRSSSDHSKKGATSSDLSDIPNLEQMDYGKFEKYVGDVPADHKPLFNPDNGKSQTIEDKAFGSNQVITPADLQENPANAKAESHL